MCGAAAASQVRVTRLWHPLGGAIRKDLRHRRDRPRMGGLGWFPDEKNGFPVGFGAARGEFLFPGRWARFLVGMSHCLTPDGAFHGGVGSCRAHVGSLLSGNGRSPERGKSSPREPVVSPLGPGASPAGWVVSPAGPATSPLGTGVFQAGPVTEDCPRGILLQTDPERAARPQCYRPQHSSLNPKTEADLQKETKGTKSERAGPFLPRTLSIRAAPSWKPLLFVVFVPFCKSYSGVQAQSGSGCAGPDVPKPGLIRAAPSRDGWRPGGVGVEMRRDRATDPD